jgi:hypothetical protein
VEAIRIAIPRQAVWVKTGRVERRIRPLDARVRFQMRAFRKRSQAATLSNDTLGAARAIAHNRAMRSRPNPDDAGSAA